MVNVGPLTAEIGLPVWDTPASFNGFRVLAALLHGTVVVGVRQTLGVEQRAPPMFGRAAITLGIGSHSHIISFTVNDVNIVFLCSNVVYILLRCCICGLPVINKRICYVVMLCVISMRRSRFGFVNRFPSMNRYSIIK